MKIDRSTVFRNGWLNIEATYEATGWDVQYDKPAYYEDREATFTFTPKT